MVDDACGDVQQSVAQPLGFGSGERASEADQPRPAEQILGDQRDLKPRLVVLEGVVGQVAHAAVLALADAVFDAGAAAMAQLQHGDVVAVLVGQQARVAVAEAVKDSELRTGVRALAAADQPAARGPARQLDMLGQLGDPRAVAQLAVRLDRRDPRDAGELENRGAHGLVELIADREADVGLAAVRAEGVRGAADVGPHEDLATEISGGQLLQRESQHLEVVGGRVGPGVPRPQNSGERLTGLIQGAENPSRGNGVKQNDSEYT